ncbi:MAG: phosphoribosylglycinamide formyltransferase [Symbiobacteriia bacterium]
MSGASTLGILASGRGSNMEAILDAVQAGRLPLRPGVLVSNRPAARALGVARERGVPAVFVDPKPFGPDREGYDRELVRVLQLHGVDLVALAGYMRLVTPAFLTAFPGRVLNVHPSLLPAFPGLNAQAQALAYGVKVSGCTVFFVDDGVDTGPILLQAAVPVQDDDTEATLAARILEQEHRLFPQALGLVATGQFRLDGRRVTRLATISEEG